MAAQYLAAASAQGDEDAEAALQGLLAFKRGEGSVMPAKAEPTQSLQNRESITIHPSTWILQQKPNHYTIQVIALRSRKDLQTLIQSHPELTPYATYTQQKNNEPLYVLIQGAYPSLESARLAKSQFPGAIQLPKHTWIREFKKIQALINP